MAANKDECGCGERKTEPLCRSCAEREEQRYWCEVCERPVAGKRCPLCGLKARRMRAG